MNAPANAVHGATWALRPIRPAAGRKMRYNNAPFLARRNEFMPRLCCFFAVCALLGTVLPASAAVPVTRSDNFAARVSAAQVQEKTTQGQAFQKDLHALVTPYVLGFMVKKCSMTTGIKPLDFDFVANISRYRTLQDYQPNPSNKLTQCLGARLTGVCYPWIPTSYKKGGFGYPVELHVKASYTDGIVIKEGQRLRLNGSCPGF